MKLIYLTYNQVTSVFADALVEVNFKEDFLIFFKRTKRKWVGIPDLNGYIASPQCPLSIMRNDFQREVPNILRGLHYLPRAYPRISYI